MGISDIYLQLHLRIPFPEILTVIWQGKGVVFIHCSICFREKETRREIDDDIRETVWFHRVFTGRDVLYWGSFAFLFWWIFISAICCILWILFLTLCISKKSLLPIPSHDPFFSCDTVSRLMNWWLWCDSYTSTYVVLNTSIGERLSEREWVRTKWMNDERVRWMRW